MKKYNGILKFIYICLLVSSSQMGSAQQAKYPAEPEPPAEPKPIAYSEEDTFIFRFPDYGYMLDTDQYQGRLFKLSQQYPEKLPAKDAGIKNILKIDFTRNWKEYLYALRDYVLEGNIGIEHKDYENAFFLEDNRVRNWFHPPWLHWGVNGSEGFHGLQQDAKAIPHLLAETQNSSARIYSVSFYNDRGGFVVDKVWPRNKAGFDLSYFDKGNLFPEGTVLVALAFTTAKVGEVPYLVDPIQWDAYVLCEDVPNCEPVAPKSRVKTRVALIQMDVMIRDDRANDTGGWSFSSFLYNGNLGHKNKWLNLVPMGMSWGNDPQVRLSSYNLELNKTIVNKELKATRINLSSELPNMRLGFGGRFNGMFNGSKNAYVVSCGSCHTAAQFPTLSAVSPRVADPIVPIPDAGTNAPKTWMKWYQDLKPGETLDQGTIMTDKSMLLLKGIYAYLERKEQIEEGTSSARREKSKLFTNLSN